MMQSVTLQVYKLLDAGAGGFRMKELSSLHGGDTKGWLSALNADLNGNVTWEEWSCFSSVLLTFKGRADAEYFVQHLMHNAEESHTIGISPGRVRQPTSLQMSAAQGERSRGVFLRMDEHNRGEVWKPTLIALHGGDSEGNPPISGLHYSSNPPLWYESERVFWMAGMSMFWEARVMHSG